MLERLGARLANQWFELLIGALMAAALLGASDFPRGAAIYPRWVTIAGLAIWVAHLCCALAGRQGAEKAFDATSESAGYLGLLRYSGWMAGYYVAIIVLGFLLSTLLFVVAFLRLEGRAPWPLVLLWTTLAVGLTAGLGAAIDVYWPRGFLLPLVGLGV